MTDDEKLTELEVRVKYMIEHGMFEAVRAGKFAYYDEMLDAIHTLRQRNARLVEGLEEIEGQALCHGMRADEAELRSWLENIAGITARTLIEDNSNG